MNLRAHCIWWNLSLTAADPDLQISGMGGGGWGSHPDPEIRGRPSLKKNFFRPQFGLKIRGRGAGPPGPSPGSALD